MVDLHEKKAFSRAHLFTSHDHQLTQTVANRIIDIKADKVVDREVTYNEYLGVDILPLNLHIPSFTDVMLSISR